MASDFLSLRSQLKTSNVESEAVEINQRALIDKILARYSTEYTFFRELLQNSNDANATEVTITFQTKGGKANAASTITYSNNGRPFRDEDWYRLRKIAEGNPDQDKIGFFGVGFYSLFSVCEEPLVTSGTGCMAFFWKGDSLYTKRGPAPTASDLTTFFLELREPLDIPNIADFGRFLATSVPFTANLRNVSVIVDTETVFSLHKKTAEARPLTFPKNLYQTVSPNSMLTLDQVNVSQIQLDVDAMLSFDRSKGRQGTKTSFSIFMRVATAGFGVRLATKFAQEMERTTKKKPPTKTSLQIMWSTFDEYDSSSGVRGQNSVFSDLLPAPGEQGRIFIGFPTHQTTGCSMHLAAHLIPTVERESIDFVDRTLTIWNQEILVVGALVARILYEDEMTSIQKLYPEVQSDPAAKEWMEKKGAHAMMSFNFKASTPHSVVAKILGSYFLKQSSEQLTIMSSRGVMPANKVRILDPSMSAFIKNIPFVPELVAKQCAEMIKNLEKDGVVRTTTVEDVLEELGQRTLTSDEFIALMKWWVALRGKTFIPDSIVSRFLQLAVIPPTSIPGVTTKMTLAHIKSHMNVKIIPPDCPAPSNSLPSDIAKSFTKNELEQVFGWMELTLVEWCNFLAREKTEDLEMSAPFTERILGVVSRAWGNISQDNKVLIISIFCIMKCIPTRSGMKLPEQAYFKNVTLFADLPSVAFANPKSVSEVMLKAFGVREHVELQTIFDRLGTELGWDHHQLVKYLATIQAKLSNLEFDRLRATALFPREAETEAGIKRYRASELYAPDDKLRKLGVSILKWDKWRSQSDEAKLMMTLGLKTVVPLSDLFAMMATATEPSKRALLLEYFIDNHKTTYASIYRPETVQIPFLPTVDASTYAKPADCFSEPGGLVMGFLVLKPDLKPHADKFGCRPHPPSDQLVARLRERPPPPQSAVAMFTYLASRQHDFTVRDWTLIRDSKFIPVPITTTSPPTYKCMTPGDVYFNTGSKNEYADFFTFVDFGHVANTFLRAAGVKDEPTPAELAQQLVKSPRQFLDASGTEKYLGLLRRMATNFSSLSQNAALLRDMRSSAFLIGLKGDGGSDVEVVKSVPTVVGNDAAATTTLAHDGIEGDGAKVQVTLAKASDIYLIDDTILQQIFQPLSCILEPLLENFYEQLGSSWLSPQVQQSWSVPRNNHMETDKSKDLQKLIRQRAPLLLYDGHRMRTVKEVVNNAESLLKDIMVIEVKEIEIVRTFKGNKNRQNTTSCLLVDERSRQNYVFVAGEYDFFDVAQALGRVVFRHPRLNDTLLLSTLLSTSLVNLKRKGFPIDRILNISSQKIKNAATIPDTPPPSSPAAVSTESSSKEAVGMPDMPDATPQVRSYVRQLLGMFPDADSEVVRRAVEAEKSGKDVVTNVSNRMLDQGYPRASNPINRSKPVPPIPPAALTAQQANGDSQNGVVARNNPPTPEKDAATDDFFGVINRFAENMRSTVFGGGPSSSNSNGGLSSPAPPSATSSNNQLSTTQSIRSANDEQGTKPPIDPSQTSQIRNSLSRSIQTLKSTKDSTFSATVPSDPPAIPSNQSPVCRVIAENDMIMINSVDGLSFYRDRRVAATDESVTNMAGIQRFVKLIKVLAQVYSLDLRACSIYVDVDGTTIAFNRGRSLFFNVRYYLGLHYPLVKGNGVARIPGGFGGRDEDVPDAAETYYYWFLVFAHELAHNFAHGHDSDHEFYLTSFAEHFMSNLIKQMLVQGVSV
ncbi:hypothetical protein SmJEL517_g03025 [Synchytrium microbalum]|uniref:Sacsin/Nov domain-containing protein n=1 Tax=Synchytrium microbalum TaxID=1806994 RepID=A0A507C9X8_9FUNG|nr:uncharacterized protein SmJEL517_g03025 [Synchytrium microbalum]TPX34353.1 hypothetical protein SmJEL517_g03025 [Synchytrium microbalum]